MPYEAGQYLELCYPSGEFFPFSIANAPQSDGLIELHIKLSPTDTATLEFIEQLAIGSSITVRGAFGDSRYQPQKNPLLLLAAGTGFSPAKAIIEKIIQTNVTRDCHLYWSVKVASDFYSDLPSYWNKTLKNFFFSPILTQEIEGQKTTILEKVLHDFESFRDYQVYVFGPEQLAIATIQKLHARGLLVENFFSDMLSQEQVAKIVKSKM
jgi:CDP-4-dehydro-6-deoxyglucose reductase